MILYNVTCLVEDAIREEWLTWMKEVHLPEVMATGKFISSKMFIIDPHSGEDTGTSYSIQYTLENRSQLEAYATNDGLALKAKPVARYGAKVVAFRTILEEV
jgi:hypothetical protein